MSTQLPPIQISKKAVDEAQSRLQSHLARRIQDQTQKSGEKESFKQIQQGWEAFGFSSLQYLPAELKQPWLILLSVVCQLDQILAPAESCEGENSCAGCENGCTKSPEEKASEVSFTPEASKAPKAPEKSALPQLPKQANNETGDCASGGCSTEGCGDITVTVCNAVLDHLFNGEATGRADLDAFSPIVRRYNLKKASLDTYCQNQGEWQKLTRIVSWDKLSSLFKRRYGPALEVFIKTLPPEIKGLSYLSFLRSEVPILLGMTMLMANLKQDLAAGRVTLPQDDLVKSGMGEKRLKKLTTEETLCEEDREKLQMLLAIQQLRFDSSSQNLEALIQQLPGHQYKMAGLVWLEAIQTRFKRQYCELTGTPFTTTSKWRNFLKNTWRAAVS